MYNALYWVWMFVTNHSGDYIAEYFYSLPYDITHQKIDFLIEIKMNYVVQA